MPSPPPYPKPGTLLAKVANNAIQLDVAVYRVTGGRLRNSMNGGKAPVLLLDHVGRKSQKKRTTPLLYLADGDKLVIVASRGGSHATPAWWLNLQANPATSVQVRSDRRRVVAREATDEEHERYWPQLTAMYPDYDVYQSRTDRPIPVIVLSPA
jgi:deazaflavin-dependent oxidoreductase (nitroreductase family)